MAATFSVSISVSAVVEFTINIGGVSSIDSRACGLVARFTRIFFLFLHTTTGTISAVIHLQ